MNIFVSILGCIFVLAAAIVGGIMIYRHADNQYGLPMDEKKPFPKKRLAPCVFVIFVGFGMFILGQAFIIIPTGSTGVLSTFGLISEQPLNKGFNWKTPFVDSVEIVNNKQQDMTMASQVWSETAEQTAMYMENVTITFAINPERSAWIYAHVTDYDKKLLTDDMISSALKTASRTITTTDVTNRGVIEPAARITLQEVCDEKYGEGTVQIVNVVINNMDFEDSYNAAIAARQEAIVQQEQQAIENKTNIDKANAEAEAVRARAQGEADATLVEANAKAEANEIISKSITEQTQRQDAIAAWDGALPRYIGGNGDASAATFGIMDSVMTGDKEE